MTPLVGTGVKFRSLWFSLLIGVTKRTENSGNSIEMVAPNEKKSLFVLTVEPTAHDSQL